MSSLKTTTDLSGLSKQYSSRDLPTHLKLKYREIGQGAPEEHKTKDKRDLKKELDERERQNKESKRSLIDINNEAPINKKQKIESITNNEQTSTTITQLAIEHNLDADEPIINNDSDDDDDDEYKNRDNEDEDYDDDDDDEEDTAALLAELERIKKERAAEAAKEEANRLKREEKIRSENILKGNPLLNNQKQNDFKVKRRWDDDVVFKNCAKLDSNTSSSSALVKKTGQFINDTLRSEFHKKFMDRYIK
jgi:protein CWC15